MADNIGNRKAGYSNSEQHGRGNRPSSFGSSGRRVNFVEVMEGLEALTGEISSFVKAGQGTWSALEEFQTDLREYMDRDKPQGTVINIDDIKSAVKEQVSKQLEEELGEIKTLLLGVLKAGLDVPKIQEKLGLSSEEEGSTKPAKKRGRPPKNALEAVKTTEPAKKRGRPPKKDNNAVVKASEPSKKRGRPPKVEKDVAGKTTEPAKKRGRPRLKPSIDELGYDWRFKMIKGLGPRRIDELVEVGMTTLEQLAAPSNEEVDFIIAAFGNGRKILEEARRVLKEEPYI